MPIKATGLKQGHPARYGYHHCRSCPLTTITLRKSSFGNVQHLRGIRFSDSLTDSISCSAAGRWWATAESHRLSMLSVLLSVVSHTLKSQLSLLPCLLLFSPLSYTSFTWLCHDKWWIIPRLTWPMRRFTCVIWGEMTTDTAASWGERAG